MAERKKHLSRTEERAAARKSVTRNVKAWPMGLELNVSRITRLAADEWNFEKLYEQVRRFAGGSVSREVLQEFLKERGITLKSRPQGGGRLA